MDPRSILQRLGMTCIVSLMSGLLFATSASSMTLSDAQALDSLGTRASTCANSLFNSCTTVDSRLPSDFCCSSTTSCVSLDSSSSALCCQTGKDCSIITPISCDIAQQNATRNPEAGVHTSKLDGSLPTCGTNCCPFGYTCDIDSSSCHIEKETSSYASGFNNSSSSSTSSISTTTATTTGAASPNSTAASSASASNGTGIDSTNPGPMALCSRFPGAAVAAGFFPGVLAGALLASAVIFCLGGKSRHSSRSSSNSASSKFTSHFRGRSSDGAIIGVSGPIPQSQSARTDFLRREPTALKRTGTRVKTWFSTKSSPTYGNDGSPYDKNNWKMPTPPVPNNIPMAPVGKVVPAGKPVPVTPERQIIQDNTPRNVRTEPSTESIKVYSPPSMLGTPHGYHTTITPVRGMATQRNLHDAVARKMGPPKAPQGTDASASRLATTLISAETTLSPARYGGSNTNLSVMEDVSRPTTTFTDMLHGIGFPDPAAPTVPDMPKRLDTKKGRKPRR